MKQVLVGIMIVVCAVGVMIYFRAESPQNKAMKAELKGEPAKATTHYYKALLKATDGMKLPDKNRSRTMSADAWNAEVFRYLQWVTGLSATGDNHVGTTLLQSLRVACGKVDAVHFITDDSLFTYTEERLLAADWDRAFFPSNVSVAKDQSSLIHKAWNDSVSLLRIRALASYAFSGMLLDLSSMKRTDFSLAPEDEVSLLVRPHGQYLLICSSEVTFTDGKIWRSPVNIFEITSTNKASLRTFVLSGRVRRG